MHPRMGRIVETRLLLAPGLMGIVCNNDTNLIKLGATAIRRPSFTIKLKKLHENITDTDPGHCFAMINISD